MLPVMWTASGSGAEADHLCVEADGNVDVVIAGKEEEGVAAAAELGVFLLGVDIVDLACISAAGVEGEKTKMLGPRSDWRFCCVCGEALPGQRHTATT